MSPAVSLDEALSSAGHLRFLCSGNVVRSAFAELYARHAGCPVPVDSAATTFQNPALFPETRAALRELGVDAAWLDAFRPRHLSRLEPTDPQDMVVFGMSREHLDAWRVLRPNCGPTFLLAEVLGRRRRIADPVLEGASFEATYREVRRCVDALVDALAGRQRPRS